MAVIVIGAVPNGLALAGVDTNWQYVVIGMVTYVTLLERKFAARMQSRIGPYRVGPHGLLQPIADAVKLMMKEDVVPRLADRSVYNLAPIVFLVPCMFIFATLPFAPGLGIADLNIGILFFLAVSAMEIVGLFMGDQALVVEGVRNGRPGTAIVDRDQVYWFYGEGGQDSGMTGLAWSIYKGRRLLSVFNLPEVWPGDAGDET